MGGKIKKSKRKKENTKYSISKSYLTMYVCMLKGKHIEQHGQLKFIQGGERWFNILV